VGKPPGFPTPLPPVRFATRARLGFVRGSFAALLSLFTLAACGGSDEGSTPSNEGNRVTLDQLWRAPGEDVGITPGTFDHGPGLVRFSFLIIRNNGQPVYRPKARFWVAEDRDAAPFASSSARLEPVGVPGGYEDDHGVTHLYVARVRLDRPGTYWVLAEPVGGVRIQALGNLEVESDPDAPEVGSKAYPSRTPTLESEPNVAALTTRDPPDYELLRHSVADSIAAHKPFVLTFATPKFCTSRTCGPVVDVVNAVRMRFALTDIRFIHVEVYEGNDPALGPNRWFQEWRLAEEPWTFLVGRDGRIKERFAGSFSVAELTAAVRKHLARRAS
jgi:hypothetical protein